MLTAMTLIAADMSAQLEFKNTF